MISKNDLKFIKSLKLKKYRQREKKFIVHGAKSVTELLNSDYKVEMVLHTKEFEPPNPSSMIFHEVDQKTLESASAFQSNSSCIAVANTREWGIKDLSLSKNLLVLDGVSDPGNLGTIIRSLDWFGYDSLLCSEDCAEFYNSKTISATMGSFTRVKVAYEDLPQVLKSISMEVYGMTISGGSLGNLTYKEPSIFVLGSESHGIRPSLKPILNNEISIQKYGHAESLNVAMAGSILLYQLSL